MKKRTRKLTTQEDRMMFGEERLIKRLITEIYPTGVVSLVSDTFDFFRVLTKILPRLKNKILNRKPNAIGLAKVVFRPDSGDPVKIICGENFEEVPVGASIKDWGYDALHELASDSAEHGCCGDNDVECLLTQGGKNYKVTAKVMWNRHAKQYYYFDGLYDLKVEEVELTPEQKGACQCLWDVFGGTINEQGYKVLNERVGLIYGDSITLERCKAILEGLEAKGFASSNIVFGIGSFTYQFCTRDNFGFAMKATYGEVNGVGRPIFKDPKTDDGVKKSAKGLLRVEKEGDDFVLYDEQDTDEGGCLELVFEDGVLIRDETLSDIRTRVRNEL